MINIEKYKDYQKNYEDYQKNYEKYILNMPPHDPYVYEIRNNLSNEMCESIINKFKEEEEFQEEGFTIGGLNPGVKKTKEIYISHSCDRSKFWKEIDKKLSTKLTQSLNEYAEFLIKNAISDVLIEAITNDYWKLNDTGYQIQEYKKNEGFYQWHTDGIPGNCNDNINQRMIAFIWYLNTVDVGGETMFSNGKIKAEKGKLLLFPTTWTYMHRGNMPISDNKYIITGWIYQRQKTKV
jgi:hypothetical protein